MSIRIPDDFDEILYNVSNTRKRYPEACSKYYEKILKYERNIIVETEVIIPQSKKVIQKSEFTPTEKTLLKHLTVPMTSKQKARTLQLKKRNIAEIIEQLKNENSSSVVSYLKKASQITANSKHKITTR